MGLYKVPKLQPAGGSSLLIDALISQCTMVILLRPLKKIQKKTSSKIFPEAEKSLLYNRNPEESQLFQSNVACLDGTLQKTRVCNIKTKRSLF